MDLFFGIPNEGNEDEDDELNVDELKVDWPKVLDFIIWESN